LKDNLDFSDWEYRLYCYDENENLITLIENTLKPQKTILFFHTIILKKRSYQLENNELQTKVI
jgi:hypothetical protein